MNWDAISGAEILYETKDKDNCLQPLNPESLKFPNSITAAQTSSMNLSCLLAELTMGGIPPPFIFLKSSPITIKADLR